MRCTFYFRKNTSVLKASKKQKHQGILLQEKPYFARNYETSFNTLPPRALSSLF